MTLESSNTTVGILYDIENAPFEMLNYTLGKARRFQPCRTIVISDWEERPEQKRWEKLLRRPGFTFRQISRTFLGKNSLDSALYDSAKLLYEEGVRRYFIITTDSDFVRIAQMLNSKEKSYIIGVGTKQASETLRNAYDEFIVYPAEEKETVRKKHTRKKAETAEKAEEALEKAEPKANKKAEPKKDVKSKKAKANKAEKNEKEKSVKAAKQEKAAKATKAAKDAKNVKAAKSANDEQTAANATAKNAKSKAAQQTAAAEKPEQANHVNHAAAAPSAAPAAKPEHKEKAAALPEGTFAVRLPKTLRKQLEARMQEEEVTMDELITYLLMRGLSH
ncbi:NYN domain-containing protein [uncultured Mitsuokella sp.]|uniref:NYN domain-containing protein n=1 Tax=uncultured Mitsuokella sp. TaxID=453120 RepID=UPI0025912F51|nr:NYN domain-containing protein [uncultured Mitsuokella sp.]